ncbi:MAG TPA: hypothetical protein VKC57_14340, partial [Ktedonobacterales bacterium]|nr:hypothetical protein [Ktedonobacterales bacterium]
MLETVREYALEQLEEAGEATDLRRRHATYILELAERVAPEAIDAAHAAVLECEREEVRAALGWAASRPEVELAVRLATGAWTLWYFRSHYAEGRDWFGQVLALPGADSSVWGARARLYLGQLLLQQGEYAAADATSRIALAGYTAGGDDLGVALATRLLGNVAMWRGDLAQAGMLLGKAAQRLRELKNPGAFGALFNFATVALESGDANRALALAADIEELGQAWQPLLASAWAVFLRGAVAARRGDAELAERLLARALDLQQPLGHHQLRLLLLTELAHTLLDQNRIAEAKTTLGEAVQEAHRAGLRNRLTRAMDAVARAAAVSQPAAAVRLAGAAAAGRTVLGVVAWPREIRRNTIWLAAARRKLGKHAYEAAWAAGARASVDEAADMARRMLGECDAQPE